jgi:hypothetical protein
MVPNDSRKDNMRKTYFYVAQDGYEVMLDLDKATGIQRFNNHIVVHYGHPNESFTIYDDKTEFDVINAYFESLRDNRLRLRDFMSQEELIQHTKGT